MSRRTTLLAFAAIALVVIVGSIAARRGGHPTPVREVVVHYATFRTKLPETGVVQLPKVVTIPAGAAGNVGDVFVRAGDRVAKGQLLATIVNAQLVSSLHDAEDNALSAQGHAQSVAESTAVLPQQNRSAVVQAQAAVVAARSQLTQAEQDVVAGSQSGLGYGAATAQEQRLGAQSTLAKAQTDLREAQRTYEANKYLYDQKGISRDALMTSQARFDEARVTYEQARSERQILGGTLSRETQVLRDRVRSAQDQLRQADAALASAQANASESKAGDLVAARADAARTQADLAYARGQVERLQIRAPLAGIVQSVAAQPNDTLRPIAPGEAVVAGQALFTLAADDRFVVRTKVDEQDVAGLRLGQRAMVGGEDFGAAKLSGRVVDISPVAQRSDDPSNTSRQVLTTIALDRTLPFLRDGMTVDVDIVTRDVPHVLTVPTDAMRKDARGAYLFIVRDGRAQRASATFGEASDTEVVVTAGLHAGDTVVADKSAEIVAGTAVQPAAAVANAASAAP